MIMRKIFLSYSTKDSEVAAKVKKAFKDSGHDVWFAPEDIKGGEHYATEIEQGIENSEVFVLLASKHSVGNKRLKIEASEDVGNEIQLARNGGLKIVPLKADDSLETGAKGGNNYLHSRIQWIELSNALTSGDFLPIVEQVIASADKIETKSLDEQYLEEAEFELILGKGDKAVKAIGEYTYKSKYQHQVEFLKSTAFLIHLGLKDLKLEQADKLVGSYKPLLKTDMAVPAAYMLALLSRYYYKNISDPTNGFNSLKQQFQDKDRVEPKYRMIADQLLPKKNQFAIDWQL